VAVAPVVGQWQTSGLITRAQKTAILSAAEAWQ